MFLTVRKLDAGLWSAAATIDGYTARSMSRSRADASWGAVQAAYHWAQQARHHRPWRNQAPGA